MRPMRLFGNGEASISIRKQVAALLLLFIIAPVTTLSVISYNLSKQVIQRKTTLYNIDILTEISNNIERRLGEIDSLTVYICCNDSIQDRVNDINAASDRSRLVGLKQQLVRELINMTVANSAIREFTLRTTSGVETGNSLVGTTSVISYTDDDIARLRDARGSLVWIARSGKNPSILLGREINDLATQQPIGYLIARYDDSVLTSILDDTSYFADGALHLIDEENRVISSNRPDVLGQPFEYTGVIDAGKNSVYVPGAGLYVSYCQVPGTGWRLVSVIPAVYFEKEILQLRLYTVLLAAGVALVMMLIAWWFARHLINPIMNLCAAMRRVGDGDFGVKQPVRYRNEIGMLYRYFYQMVDRVQELIGQTNTQQQLIQKAELNSLRMQINPHFIYNTLESIKWIAHLNKNDDIVIMVKALADFMRSSISGAEFVTLKTEMTSVGNYLTIQKYRYGSRLTVQIDVPAELEEMMIPKFILQPLIENAIVHGLEQKVGMGCVSVCAKREGEDVLIVIADNGIGISQEALTGLDLDASDAECGSGGIGLRNVHQRIRMYYGRKYGLSVSSIFGIETTVTIRIPYSR
jgi:two-component system sensor histidine kinase YesM